MNESAALVSRPRGFLVRMMARLLPPVLSVDLRSDALYWAESVHTLGEPRLYRWGRLPREAGESTEALLERLRPRLRGSEIVLAMRDPDLSIERMELPGLSPGEARLVAARRAHELVEDMPLDANGDCLVGGGRNEMAAWLVACPGARTNDAIATWEASGGTVRQLVGLPIALASLGALVESPASGELVAIFDLDETRASCALIDSKGWVFSREIVLKNVGDAGEDFFEDSRSDRIATELRRTIHYAEAELRLGTVNRLVLTGTGEDPRQLATELATRLEIPVKALCDWVGSGPAEGAPSGCGVALGLAMAASRGGGDLQGDERRAARAARTGRRKLALAAGVAALLLVAGLASHAVSWSSARSEIASLDEIWAAEEHRRSEIEATREARNRALSIRVLLDELASPRPNWRASLESLGLMLPDRAVVDQFQLVAREGGFEVALEVEFRGEDLSSAAETAARFGDVVRASPMWTLRGSEQRPVPGADRAPGTSARLRYRIETALAPSDPSLSLPLERAPDA